MALIPFSCPSCGKRLQLPPSAAGKKGRCPYCKARVAIPSSSDSTVGLITEAADRPPDAVDPAALVTMPAKGIVPFGDPAPAARNPDPTARVDEPPFQHRRPDVVLRIIAGVSAVALLMIAAFCVWYFIDTTKRRSMEMQREAEHKRIQAEWDQAEAEAAAERAKERSAEAAERYRIERDRALLSPEERDRADEINRLTGQELARYFREHPDEEERVKQRLYEQEHNTLLRTDPRAIQTRRELQRDLAALERRGQLTAEEEALREELRRLLKSFTPTDEDQ